MRGAKANFRRGYVVLAVLLFFQWNNAVAQLPPVDLAGLASTAPADAQRAFQLPAADLPFSEVVRFLRGRDLFHQRWPDFFVAGSAVPLGVRNADSCVQCHIRSGRGALRPSEAASSPLAPFVPFAAVFDGVPGRSHSFGHALQDVGSGAGRFVVSWAPFTMIDVLGGRTSLVRPIVSNQNGAADFLHLRISPPMAGGALLEAIEDSDIIRWQATEGRGRVRFVESSNSAGVAPSSGVGRFGHRADRRTIRDVVINALGNDLGVAASNYLTERELDDLVFYASEVGVPGRSSESGRISAAGYEVFAKVGCASCHRPSYSIQREVRGRRHTLEIWPFTDLLLHDLGREMGGPDGQSLEWRTAPLWGIGRTRSVLGFEAYLHDGRARSLHEAIMWHGGGASSVRDGYVRLTPEEKARLIEFLRSL